MAKLATSSIKVKGTAGELLRVSMWFITQPEGNKSYIAVLFKAIVIVLPFRGHLISDWPIVNGEGN